jgi:hypothetical protein
MTKEDIIEMILTALVSLSIIAIYFAMITL